MEFSFALICLALAFPVTSLPTDTIGLSSDFSWKETKFFLAFGDSYTYVQGTLGRQNYSFIGDVQNYSFTPSQLLGNEIIQNQIGTSAGGPNWVEYLTGCFSGLPSKCRTQLWDFAFAGSDVSVTYTPLHHDYTVSFVSQISQYLSYAHSTLSALPAAKKALVAIFIGINDINDSSKYTFPYRNTTTYAELYNATITEEFAALKGLYDVGYRNFLIMGLPPLERTPGNIKLGPEAARPNATMVATYNSIVLQHSEAFQKLHHRSKMMFFDTHGFLSKILDHPSDYGIKNITQFCPNYNAPDISTNYAAYGCSPIQEYFWYNSGHITYKIHELLAGELRTFLNKNSC